MTLMPAVQMHLSVSISSLFFPSTWIVRTLLSNWGIMTQNFLLVFAPITLLRTKLLNAVGRLYTQGKLWACSQNICVIFLLTRCLGDSLVPRESMRLHDHVFSMVKRNTFIKRTMKGLKRCLSGKEHVLILQKTRVQIPVYTVDNFRPRESSAPFSPP